jgi:hypothetical protein
MQPRLVASAVVALAVTSAFGVADAAAQSIRSPTLRLVDQTVLVPAAEGAPVVFVLDIDAAGGDPAELVDAGWTVIVRAHDPVADRFAFDQALNGELPAVYDFVEVPLTADTPAAPAEDTTARTLRTELAVAVELENRTVEALRLSDAGVYPVELVLTDPEGRTRDQVLTFLEREPDPAADPTAGDRLALSLVAAVDGGPAHRPDGSITVPDDARAQLLRLLAVLEGAPGVPVTAGLRPELLAGMVRSGSPTDDELIARLRSASGSLEALATTYVRLDPSGAQQAGLAETFTEQLRLGEDTLAEVLPGLVSRRAVWIADHALDGSGAQLLRDLGIRAAVLTPPTQLETADGAPVFADPTLQFRLAIPSGSPMAAADIDLRLAERLARPTDAPRLASAHLYAELAVIRAEILARGEPLQGRSLAVATTDAAPADPAVLLPLIELVRASGRFELVGLTTAVATTDEVLLDGRPLTFELPVEAGPDLSDLAHELERYHAETEAMASMLPSGDPRPERWSAILDLLPAEAWSDADRAELTSTIDADTDELASALVLPSATRFTLGGRRSEIVLGIRNEGDTELRAEVRLRSAKLTFPAGRQVEVFPPGELTRVSVPVEARTNGQFAVSVELVTPSGDLALGPPVVMTASVNALAGLGQLLSGAALLVLATWWVHHLRVRRRTRRAEALGSATTRHPAAATENGSTERTTLSDP